MIKDGCLELDGKLVDHYVEGDPAACPRCGKAGCTELLRAYALKGGQFFRLRCTECGYEIPENLAMLESDDAKGVAEAVRVWDDMAAYEFAVKRTREERERRSRYDETFVRPENGETFLKTSDDVVAWLRRIAALEKEKRGNRPAE